MRHIFNRRVARATATVVLTSLLLVALAWLAAVRLMHDELDAAIQSAYRQNANLALAFEQHSLSTIEAVDQVLQAVIATHVRGRTVDAETLERARQIHSAMVQSVVVTDAGGHVIARGSGRGSVNLSDRAFFAQHRDHDQGALIVGAPVASRMTGRTIIPVSRRMSHADGSFAGIAVAGVDPVAFVANYQKMELGRSGLIVLAGLDGVGRVRRTGAIISTGEDMTSSRLFKAQAASGNGAFLSLGARDGIGRFTSYRTLPGFDLVVSVGTAEADVLEAYAERRNAFVTAGALFTAVVIIAACLILVAMRGRSRMLAEALRNEAQFSATFHQEAIGVAHLALDGRFLKVNEKLCRLLRYPEAELLARTMPDLELAEDRGAVAKAIAEVVRQGALEPIEGRYLRRDGTLLVASIAPALVHGLDGERDFLVVMVQDIGERVAAHEKILRRSQFDPLTDLPNRTLFEERLAQVVMQARYRRWTAGVMFIDLDGFKAVNDTLGHAAGDELLREVGRRLDSTIRPGDTAARVGGDEFAVLLAVLARAQDAAVVARKIIDAFGAPFVIDGKKINVGASIGIALFPEHGIDGKDLLRKADAAMFEAKQSGKNAFRVHDPERTPRAA